MTHIIDTPEGIAAFRETQIYFALKIEATTGLRHSRGSVLKLVQKEYGITARTKKQALRELYVILRNKGLLPNVKAPE